MFDELTKLNIETCPDAELITWLRQAFPYFIECHKRFCNSQPLSCQDCSQRTQCGRYNKGKADKTCLILEPSLPDRYEGSGYREKKAGLMIEEYPHTNESQPEDAGDDDINIRPKPDKSILKAIRKTRLDEEFMLYKNCPPFIFRPEQWEAICLRFEHGLKQQKIAETLGISRTAVSDRLRRAKKNMENHYRRKNF